MHENAAVCELGLEAHHSSVADVVEYTLLGSNPIERFAELDTNTKIDRSSFSDVDRFALAASGAAFLKVHEVSHIDTINFPPTIVIDESWAELVAFPSVHVVRRYTNTTQESMNRSFISDDGRTAWLYREHQADCGLPGPAFCVDFSNAILVANFGAIVYDTGPRTVDAMDSFANGRYLVYDKFNGPPGPVTIIDWMSGHTEQLTNAVAYTETHPNRCSNAAARCTITARSIRGQVSNDLRVVATTSSTSNGWYEYTTSP